MIQADLSSLSLYLNRGTALLIFAVAIFIVAAHTAIAAMAAPRTSLSPRTKSTMFIIAAFLGSWLALASILGDGANFPIPLESRRSASGLVALIPFLIAVMALFVSKSLRAINSAMPALGSLPFKPIASPASCSYSPSSLMEFCRPASAGLPEWGCHNWNLRAGGSADGSAQPSECFQVGGGMESFRHARSDRRLGHRPLFRGARPEYLSAQSGAPLSRPAYRNSDARLLAPQFGRQQNGLKARRQRISAAQNGRPPPTVNRSRRRSFNTDPAGDDRIPPCGREQN